MIEIIITWVKGIIFVTLFATFLELLLPNNSMQRFVRVIMGLLIMLAIINPVIEFMQRRPGESMPALSVRPQGAGALKEEADGMVRRRDQLVKTMYQRDIAKQIQSLVVAVEGVADARIEIACDEGQNGLVKLKKVTAYVRPGKVRTGGIEKVAIGTRPGEQGGRLATETAEKIRSRLCELYYLDRNQIEIKPDG